MDALFEALRPLARGIVRRAWLVLGVALLLAAGGLSLAVQLRIDTDLSKLIPDSYPSVQALEELRQTVGGESEAAVGIVSPSFEANKAYAEALIDTLDALRSARTGEPYFNRVDYRRETAFLEDNALYFATPEELDELETYLEAEIEDAKLAANPFFFDLGDDFEDEEEADSTGLQLATVYDEIVGTEYPISPDSTALVLRLYPSGAQTNIDFIREAYAALEATTAALEPASFHPAMTVTLAGRLQRQLVEVDTIRRDVLGSFGAGVGTVLLLVVLYFLYKSYRARAGGRFQARLLAAEVVRAPVMAVLIGLPLLMSLCWTFGTAYLAFGMLNLMTSTLGLVLFGLGIDFGIHFYARYTEERGEGASVEEAVETTFVGTGQAIAIGALSTASALFVLVVADFKGFSEFGFIAGTGVLFALIAMTVVLPALIAVFERLRLLNLQATAPETPMATGASRPFGAARPVLVGSALAVVAALVFLPAVEFEYRFGELEPTYEDYNERREVIRRVYGSDGSRRNPAYVLLDDPAEAFAVEATVENLIAQDTTSPTVDRIETLQDRFPLTEAGQQARLDRIAEIRTLLADPFIQQETSTDLDRLRRASQTTSPISLDEVPEFLRNRFTTKTGEIGTFAIIYPAVGLSDGRNSMAFAEDIGTITTADGTVYHAGSTSLVAADMLRLMQQEAPWMIGATFLIVLVLMGINFRSVRWAALAVVPLVVGVLWMLLLMEIFGLRLNFYNLVVLPAVLGIGNDAGVHLVHRYREEGRGSIRRVLRSTGEHVAMGSFTTMIGFAGLLLSFHPGLKSIGILAVIGIGATLLAALLFLPALLQELERRRDVPEAAPTNGESVTSPPAPTAPAPDQAR
ncbi:MAG: MMPL family transporter [Bacteroidota bacterium]